MVEIMLHDGKTEVMLKYDKGNWTLCWPGMVKDRVTGESKPGFVPAKYYASIPAALDAILHLKVGNSDARTLEEMREQIIAARKELTITWDTAFKKPPTSTLR